MKTGLFARLAATSIKNDKKVYVPYILSGIGMIMMFYIIQFLSVSKTVAELKGGSNLILGFSLGKYIIAVFALIFLIYTNSFLIKKRNREFGLYNILGMDKTGIMKIIVWESLFIFAICITGGLFFGILFSKLAELALLYVVKADTVFTLSVSFDSVKLTVIVFSAIFVLLLIRSVFRIRKSEPLELLHSDNFGEKPPKVNWLFAVAGAVMLIAAYVMAVSIKTPLSALMIFFFAVILVIAATYLLFISGSVALCRILKGNKKYYYRKAHFISVSSMSYRMKRNGAGLAAICILSTMVIVMLASSASLYFGSNNVIKSRFPLENQITVYFDSVKDISEKKLAEIRGGYEDVFRSKNVTPENTLDYCRCNITGLLEADNFDPDSNRVINDLIIYDSLRGLYFISENDYNRIMGSKIKLQKDETLIHTVRCQYDKPEFNMNNVSLRVVGKLDEFPEYGDANITAVASIFFVVKDLSVLEPLEKLSDFNGDQMLDISYYYGYDLPKTGEDAASLIKEIAASADAHASLKKSDGKTVYRSDCLEAEKDDFFTTFGGLFFIGILLSIVFIFAMTMIIYYKQISEGYEDRTKFEIMQKVGMTKEDIRKSINSQTLTVFFAPFIMASIHFAFAFPAIWKILLLFNLEDLPFAIIVSAIVILIFAGIYAAIYKATAKAYYSIVVHDGSEE